jgi:hypothetical protein
MGTGAPGHNLSVGPQVCARCHEEPSIKAVTWWTCEERFSETQKHMAVAGVTSVFDLNEKNKDLEWRLDRARTSAWLVAILGLLAGLGLGWLAGLVRVAGAFQKMSDGISRRGLFKGALLADGVHGASPVHGPRPAGFPPKPTAAILFLWTSPGASGAGRACADANGPTI